MRMPLPHSWHGGELHAAFIASSAPSPTSTAWPAPSSAPLPCAMSPLENVSAVPEVSPSFSSCSRRSAVSGSLTAMLMSSPRHRHHCSARNPVAQFSSSSPAPWMYVYDARARAASALITSDAHTQCTHENGDPDAAAVLCSACALLAYSDAVVAASAMPPLPSVAGHTHLGRSGR